jgi:hypothetical protein
MDWAASETPAMTIANAVLRMRIGSSRRENYKGDIALWKGDPRRGEHAAMSRARPF